MVDPCAEIRLYGAAPCDKTKYYMEFMDSLKVSYVFRDLIPFRHIGWNGKLLTQQARKTYI